jgi:catechol 2,3-dioxygenase-like lactoylglutathione lyase family enzyme
MAITHVFAGVAVADYDSAREWYERPLGCMVSGTARKAVFTDPDGNMITFFADNAGTDE